MIASGYCTKSEGGNYIRKSIRVISTIALLSDITLFCYNQINPEGKIKDIAENSIKFFTLWGLWQTAITFLFGTYISFSKYYKEDSNKASNLLATAE